MRRVTIAMLLLLLAGCGGGSSTTTQADEDWNEVPLADNVFHQLETDSRFRTDTLNIDLTPGRGLEVKLAMKEGDTVVYSWRATGVDRPEQLVSEFHGHTEREPGERGTLMFYRKATGFEDRGSLVAPFDGVHGWFLRNDSYSPAVVQLTVAGFYELADDQP